MCLQLLGEAMEAQQWLQMQIAVMVHQKNVFVVQEEVELHFQELEVLTQLLDALLEVEEMGFQMTSRGQQSPMVEAEVDAVMTVQLLLVLAVLAAAVQVEKEQLELLEPLILEEVVALVDGQVQLSFLQEQAAPA